MKSALRFHISRYLKSATVYDKLEKAQQLKQAQSCDFHYVQVTPEKDKNRFWPDGSSKSHHQQFTDFQKSVMFSKGIKCWSCHDPHKPSAGNASSLRLTGNLLCQSCHGVLSGTEHLSHNLHDHGNCQACHGNIMHVTLEGTSKKALNACKDCHKQTDFVNLINRLIF